MSALRANRPRSAGGRSFEKDDPEQHLHLGKVIQRVLLCLRGCCTCESDELTLAGGMMPLTGTFQSQAVQPWSHLRVSRECYHH
jgi:hypothetical protein